MNDCYKRIQQLKNQIKQCEAEIKMLEIELHNDGMNSAAKGLQDKANLSETEAENKFYQIATAKHLKLERQYKINIIRKKDGYIERFYFADFCDVKNKLIFEVDGGYHFTQEQQVKDFKRTKDLQRMGYKVFRISNYQIHQGKTTQFLYDCYKTININI